MASSTIQPFELPEWPPSSHMKCLRRDLRSTRALSCSSASEFVVVKELNSIISLQSWLRTMQPLLNPHKIIGRFSSILSDSCCRLCSCMTLLRSFWVCCQQRSLFSDSDDTGWFDIELFDDSSSSLESSFGANSFGLFGLIGTPKSVDGTKFE